MSISLDWHPSAKYHRDRHEGGESMTPTGPPLLDPIRLASDPAQPPTVYRPAREAAYRLTRQAARDAIAAQWRADLEASAALVRRRPHDARPDDGLYDGTHRWTG